MVLMTPIDPSDWRHEFRVLRVLNRRRTMVDGNKVPREWRARSVTRRDIWIRARHDPAASKAIPALALLTLIGDPSPALETYSA